MSEGDRAQEVALSVRLSAQAMAEAMLHFKNKSPEVRRDAVASAMVNMQSLTRKWNEFMVSHGRRILWAPPP